MPFSRAFLFCCASNPFHDLIEERSWTLCRILLFEGRFSGHVLFGCALTWFQGFIEKPSWIRGGIRRVNRVLLWQDTSINIQGILFISDVVLRYVVPVLPTSSKNKSSGYPLEMSFSPVERLGTFTDHQPFPNSVANRVPALKNKEEAISIPVRRESEVRSA